MGGVGLSAIMVPYCSAATVPGTNMEQAAKIRGAKTIIGVDKVQSRLEIAKELGATHIINTSSFSSLTEDLVQAVREVAPSGSNATFDTTGVINIIDAGVQSLHLQGQMVLIGVMNGTLSVDLGTMLSVSTIIHLLSGEFC